MPLSLDLSQSASFLVDRHPDGSHGLGSQEASPDKSFERHSQTSRSLFLDENESLNCNRPHGQAGSFPSSGRREDHSDVHFPSFKERAGHGDEAEQQGGLSMVDLEDVEGSAPDGGEIQVTETDREQGSSSAAG